MKKIYFALTAIAALALGSCTDDAIEEEASTPFQKSSRTVVMDSPLVSLSIDGTSGDSVFVSGTIDLESIGVGINKKGIVYSLEPDPKIGKSKCIYRTSDNNVATEENAIYRAFIFKSRNIYQYVRTFAITANSDTIYSREDSVMIVAKAPQIETLPVKNRVKVAAVVIGKFTDQGDADIKSYGICLNETGFPTLNDRFVVAKDIAVDGNYAGRFGVFFDYLTPQKMYHVRSYCVYELNEQTDTIYGNDRIFKTTAGGDVIWQWNWKGDASEAQIDRIATAMDSACYYYNNYSNLYHRVRVTYSAGVPTAQCNIIGDMSYGAVERYQWVGTAQHEMSHAMGVGTAGNWSSFSSPWNKEIAVMTVRVMLRDMTQNISHDSQHFWPGGINQKEEVTNGTSNSKGTYICKNADMLKANAIILNAMREDGLEASSWYYY